MAPFTGQQGQKLSEEIFHRVCLLSESCSSNHYARRRFLAQYHRVDLSITPLMKSALCYVEDERSCSYIASAAAVGIREEESNLLNTAHRCSNIRDTALEPPTPLEPVN